MQVTRDDFVEAIRQAEVVDAPENLRMELKLTDQGVDSLGMYSMILALQEKFGIEIPDEDIDSLETIEEIIAYLNTRIA